MMFRITTLAAVVCLLVAGRCLAQSEIAADYAAIIGATAGTVSDGYGSPGSIPVHGRASFPVLVDGDGVPALAAGRYDHGVSPTAARAVAAAHTGFFNTSGSGTTSQLFVNSVLWASRKTTPATIRIGSNSSAIRNFFSARGYLTKAITTNMSNSSNDLSTCDVFIGNFHDGFSNGAIAKIQTFAANGGGVVVCCTPWALGSGAFANAQALLGPFGLSISGSGTATGTFTVAASSYPAYHSALNGLDQLVAALQGGPSMTLVEKRVAAAAVDRVLAVRPGEPQLVAGLESLEDLLGIISVTAAQPLVKNNKPVEAMLARYQSGKFDAMPAADLFAHPAASDWPGSPAAGAPVTRTIPVNGNVPPDVYMNQGDRGRRVETRLYAAPGATLTITIPADKVNAGLSIDIGCHIDENFHLDQWNRFPKVTRRVPLSQAVTQTGNVFGGLVWIVVPQGSSLGNFDVIIGGAVEAPCFQLGVDTDANWNGTLKNKPGAWGCIMTDNVAAYGNTPGFTVYVSRAQLQTVTSAEAVARHWKKVIETADHYMGYTAFRKRGESALSDRDIIAGGGHAGYPVMMAYGDSDVLVRGALRDGDWGYYHEIGHTFQDSFNGAYGIAPHGEVDVNLVPGLLNNLVHDKTCWDGDIHGTFNGANRLAKRTAFMARAAADQTWSYAGSDGATAYDFYFNLAEAFGWDCYRIALGRLMAWLQGGSDPALAALSSSDPNYVRNRFYLLFCDATGRNLDAYFQRYGLGVTGRGYEITQSVKDAVAAKNYPGWTDNSPVDGIADPGALTAPENLAPGTVIAGLQASDPEEPGTMWTWSILSGNSDGRVTIDKRSGELKVGGGGLDRESAASYTLGIQAQDGGVARTSATRTVTLQVGNVVEPPGPAGFTVLTATSAMSSNSVLGQAIRADATRSLSSVSILSGNGSNAFAVNASGQLLLKTPSALSGVSLVTLVVSATDNAGATGYAAVRVLVNATPGLREQRWTGNANFNNNQWTGTAGYSGNLGSATTAQNVADNYSRRVTGWLVPPVTGDYTFWIASDDAGRLYLGSGSAESSKSLIAWVNGYTSFQDFDAGDSQRSVTLPLVAGQAYWFEAQQAEGGGGDHLSVAWQGPGIARAVIAGAYLVPNQSGITAPAALPVAPVFSADPLAWNATQGVAISGSLATAASDANAGDTLTFAKVSGPAWLSVVANGALSGTPGNAQVGTQNFVVKVTDSTGLAAQAGLAIEVANVNDAPAFTSDPLLAPGGTQDMAYAGSLAGSASDIDAGDSLSFAKLSGPAWLNVAANGALSGTPGNAQVGLNVFTVEVRDAAGASDVAELRITIANVNDAPFFMASTFAGPAAVQNSAYHGTLAGQATDLDAGDALTFAKLSGPGWLDVAPDGALSGTPQQADVGANSFMVEVRDAGGLSGQALLTVVVSDANDPPVIVGAPLVRASATVGESYSGQTLAGAASDPDAGDSIAWSKVSGPAWLTVAPNGALGGTPPAGSGGANTFQVRATDLAGAFTEATLEIEVIGSGLPLPWEAAEIGAAQIAPQASYAAGTFTIAAEGALIGTQDRLQFVYQTLSGDGEIVARLDAVSGAEAALDGRAGVMFRESLAGNARHVFMGVTPQGGYRWVRRTGTAGNTSTSTSGTGSAPDLWVKLVRRGSTVTSYKSVNGIDWITVGSLTANLSQDCYFGLAVTGSGGVTAGFSHVTVGP